MHIEPIDIKKMVSQKLVSPKGGTIVTIEQEPKIPDVGSLDYRLRDDHGQEYLVEVKTGRITKLEVGQLATYATLLHKKMPSASLVLICKKLDAVDKEVLDGLGIKIIELEDLTGTGRPESVKPSKKSAKKLELSPKEQESYFLLLRKGIVVVTSDLLSKELKIPNEYSKNILSSLARKGVLSRFGRGRYATISPDIVYDRKGYTVDPMVILEQLMGNEAHYVAYASALYVHGLALQLPFETAVAVTKQRRPLRVGNSVIRFVSINRRAMFGYGQQKYLNSYVSVSDLEKTVIDCIDRHDLCGGMGEVTRSLSESLKRLDSDRLLTYLKKFRKQAVVQRLGFVLERLSSEGFAVNSETLQSIRALKFKHVYKLDFTQPQRGKTSREWKILENIDCMSWRRQ